MKASEIIRSLEERFPTSCASSWDNVGLLAGSREQEVKRIYVALDATDEIIEDAVLKGADMLLTHHPMIFSPLKKVNTDDFIGRRLVRLIENRIVYYAMHTNYDVLRMAELSAEMFGLTKSEVLEPVWQEKLYKAAVYVPVEYEEKVRTAMTEAGAGGIGNYSECTFRVQGTGTFLPGEASHAFIGEKGELTHTEEIKVETIVPQALLKTVVHKMIEAHPYEEPAYDLYLLEKKGETEGFGRIGVINQDMDLRACFRQVKKAFGLDHVKVFGQLDKKIRKAAISPGSGKSMIEPALKAGADVLITGDIDHHEGIDAVARGLAVIDAGHYGIEHIFIADMKSWLENTWKEIEVEQEAVQNPFQIL